MNNIPNINKFGAAKQPDVKKIQGSEGVRLFFDS